MYKHVYIKKIDVKKEYMALCLITIMFYSLSFSLGGFMVVADLHLSW